MPRQKTCAAILALVVLCAATVAESCTYTRKPCFIFFSSARFLHVHNNCGARLYWSAFFLQFYVVRKCSLVLFRFVPRIKCFVYSVAADDTVTFPSYAVPRTSHHHHKAPAPQPTAGPSISPAPAQPSSGPAAPAPSVSPPSGPVAPVPVVPPVMPAPAPYVPSLTPATPAPLSPTPVPGTCQCQFTKKKAGPCALISGHRLSPIWTMYFLPSLTHLFCSSNRTASLDVFSCTW
jgi:hypothetical protein